MFSRVISSTALIIGASILFFSILWNHFHKPFKPNSTWYTFCAAMREKITWSNCAIIPTSLPTRFGKSFLKNPFLAVAMPSFGQFLSSKTTLAVVSLFVTSQIINFPVYISYSLWMFNLCVIIPTSLPTRFGKSFWKNLFLAVAMPSFRLFLSSKTTLAVVSLFVTYFTSYEFSSLYII